MPADSVLFGDIKSECEALIQKVCTRHFKGKEYN